MNCGQFAVLLAFTAFTGSVYAKIGYEGGEQDYGFVDVREGAHMFYWLYYTTASVANYTERPLAIWLQGGPGASSTGYGNFEELGPIDINGNHRNTTWVKDMNVLFIDNPVGSGFSYVDNVRYLTSNNKEIAVDLVEFMKRFYKLHPEFEDVALHIFCESYGGKMAPEFALELYRAIQRKEIKSNLLSVALGDPWTSPIDSVLAWAPLLLNMGIVDQDGYTEIMKSANKTLELVENEEWVNATQQWGVTQTVLLQQSKGVDFYNIIKPTKARAFLNPRNYRDHMHRSLIWYDTKEAPFESLQNFMRGAISEALEIPSHVIWGSQSEATFDHLEGDFMKPVIHIVEELLNTTTLNVAVFSGQLDLICATPGTVDWIEKMRWLDRAKYLKAPRRDINVYEILEGYEKSAGKFSMFWVNRAGHMVPADNPSAMSHILRKLTNYG